MNAQRRKRVVLQVGLLLGGFGLVLVVGPAAAQAQCSGPNGSVAGVLRETLEAVSFPGGYRHAQATERGVLADGCGTLATFEGETSVQARSRVPVLGTLPDGTPVLGSGPISGTFHVDTTSGRVPGKLGGQLDFAPLYGVTAPWNLVGCPCPFVLALGTWTTLGGDRTGGAFNGFALVPFACGPLSPNGFCYVDPTGTLGTPGVPFPLGSEDFDQHGTPQAIFVITLIQ